MENLSAIDSVSEICSLLSSLNVEKTSVLTFGFGQSFLTASKNSDNSGYVATSIEFNPDCCSFLYHDENSSISLTTPKSKFDCFIAKDLNHLPEKDAFMLLYETNRFLRSGGTAISLNRVSKKILTFCQKTFNKSIKTSFGYAKSTELFTKPKEIGMDEQKYPEKNLILHSRDLLNEIKDFGKFDQKQKTSPRKQISPNQNFFYRESPNKTQKSKIGKVVDTLLSDPEPLCATKLASNLKRFLAMEPLVSGISLGLPNHKSGKSFFSDDNFDRLFKGENFLCELSEMEIENLLLQKVVQIDKSGGQRKSVPITRPEQMFQIVSKLGDFDLEKEFGVPRFMIEGIDKTSQLAIAAGIKALQNAKIVFKPSPEHPFGLPEHMRNETGIIFASSFPQLESCIEEVQKQMAHRFSRSLATSDNEPNLAEKVCSSKSQNLKPDKNQHAINYDSSDFSYDRKLLFKLLVMANSQLAQLTGARGPNTFINAACASTAQALALASDWMRLGRCKRVLVVAADNATSANLLPYIGTGFLALGASCTKKSVAEAATPFDRRRSGMLLGMGATGLFLEQPRASLRRSGSALAALVHSQLSNSAFHGTLLDKGHIAAEMDRFVASVCAKLRVSRVALARNLIYFAHETGTSKNGGCAGAEIEALRNAFGKNARRIMICAVKGQCGHPMGANLEDAVAVAALAYGRVPPVVNFKEEDPLLGRLRLSQGEKHSRLYAMRTSAGFGSQLVFLLYKKYSAKKCALI